MKTCFASSHAVLSIELLPFRNLLYLGVSMQSGKKMFLSNSLAHMLGLCLHLYSKKKR